MNELALFAGAGGGILAGKLLGWRTVCAVEINEHCRARLTQRQDEGHLHPFPIWDDVRTFDGRLWAGKVDIVTAGFPCQDISVSGNGEGIDGEQSQLWEDVPRICSELGLPDIYLENSPALIVRGLGRILGAFSELGYHLRWGVVGVSESATPFVGYRLWIYGNATNKTRLERAKWCRFPGPTREPQFGRCSWWDSEPGFQRVGNGMADRVERIKAIGNGQVPICAATAWKILSRLD